MTAYLFTATKEHFCELGGKHCPKGAKIKVGEMAVKTLKRRDGCSSSWSATVYYHEECYQRRGRK